MLALLILASTAVAMNVCHADCAPFHCHGPLETHCSKCSGNREVIQGRCVCRLGYFDHAGSKCSVYSQDCLEAVISPDGAVTCSKCARQVYAAFTQKRTRQWALRIQTVDVLRARYCLHGQ